MLASVTKPNEVRFVIPSELVVSMEPHIQEYSYV